MGRCLFNKLKFDYKRQKAQDTIMKESSFATALYDFDLAPTQKKRFLTKFSH